MGKARILVTGANGFIGQALCNDSVEKGYRVRAAVRDAVSVQVAHGTEPFGIGPIDGDTDWSQALDRVDKVVHLAARVHVMHEAAKDPLKEFRRVNTAGTRQLARSAAKAGVRRFVYLSTIKVNGEETTRGPYSEIDSPNPQDPYAVSKWEAEQALQQVADETGLEIVIIRPPLVYGPAVKGNFLRLMKWVDRGIPLPVKNAKNHRSLISVDNLVDLIGCCLDHPGAAGQLFLMSDGEDLSTFELVRRIARALDRTPRMFSLPLSLVNRLAHIAGHEDVANRLFGSLQIDSSKARQLLAWSSPFSVDEGLSRTAAWYREKQ